MKHRQYLGFFLFLILSLISPQDTFAQCNSVGDCDAAPPGGCAGGSVACDNGQCSYTWQCNNVGCTSWSDWSPDPCTSGQQQTRECQSGLTGYQIQNCGSGGGGGVACEPVQYCPNGWSPSFGQTPTYVRECGTGAPKLCTTPGGNSSQKIIGCCGSGQGEGDEWFCANPQYATYPCCAPGTAESCTSTPQETHIVSSGPYNLEDNGLPDLTNKCPAGETYTGTWSIGYCYQGNLQGTPVSGGRKTWCYLDLTCQPPDSVSCSCQPTCSATAPSIPALLSPANGASVTTEIISLVWNDTTQDWGTSCVTNSNSYEIYIGTSPSSLALLGTVNDGSGNSVSFGPGVTGQTYYWKVRAKNGSEQTDSAVWSFTINEGPWWQVKDGDITTTNDLTSSVPDGELFEIVGLGGFPGVPVFGSTFSLTTEPTKISDALWNANTNVFQSRIFNYAYFKNLIPEDVTFNDISNLTTGGSTYTDGYEWYKVTGDVTTVGDIDFGSRKVILFIESGNLNIGGNINLTNGLGFFGTFVNGNITISDQVTGTPSIEGIYLSDGVFSTGTSGLGDNQLHIRGSVASFGGINLERDLTSNANPAELFEFAPDQMMLFPEKLMYRRSKWQEIAP